MVVNEETITTNIKGETSRILENCFNCSEVKERDL